MPERHKTPFTVDKVASPEIITTIGFCNVIQIRQQASESASLIEFTVFRPNSNSPARDYYPGETVTFGDGKAPIQNGSIVGHIEAKNGGESGTFSQVERW